MPASPSLIVLAARALGVAAEAVAVAGERIIDVGPRREILGLRRPETTVVDAPGGLLCPGFHDSHAHLVQTGLARQELDLSGLDARAIGAAVASAAARRPPGRWIIGNGYSPARFEGVGATPRALLDEAAPDHPVFLRAHDRHTAVLNSLAVERTGAATSTGLLAEEAAWSASGRAGDVEHAARGDGVAAVLPDLHRAGITAVHDMSGSGSIETLRELDGDGRLGVDVFATLSPDGLDAKTASGDRLRITGMKAFLDGALGSRTAFLLEPYEGEPEHRGVRTLDPERALAAVRSAAEAGLPSWLHAIGDGAVRQALDVIERAGATRLRHRVEHAQMIHDEDLPRFAALGAVASVQPIHLVEDAPLAHAYWGERAREAFPLRRLLDSGAKVAFGSDSPVETFDVIDGIRAAVSRTARDGSVLNGAEAVTVREALDAYTIGAAYAAGCEEEFGHLTPGAVANLTVLSTDVERHPESLEDCAVAVTVVRGEVVFERNGS